jgi:hypothetical protein
MTRRILIHENATIDIHEHLAIFSADEYPIVSPYDSFEVAAILMQVKS